MIAFIIAGALFGVDPQLIEGICYAESKHDVNAYVARDGGSASYGMCQIKLRTARGLGFTGTAGQLREPSTNIFYATKYYRYLRGRYNSNAISSYNCGHPCRNKRYVNKVEQYYQNRQSSQMLVWRILREEGFRKL
jgi:soluble lytic murein transglycosylase-like protein